jgi:hypothetical protein
MINMGVSSVVDSPASGLASQRGRNGEWNKPGFARTGSSKLGDSGRAKAVVERPEKEPSNHERGEGEVTGRT